VRYNTQIQSERGADLTIAMDTYTPGKYSISDNRPMFLETKSLLESCWYEDCKSISKVSEFQYYACKDSPTATVSSVSEHSIASIPAILSSTGEIIRRELHIAGYLKRKLRGCYEKYGTQGPLSNSSSVTLKSKDLVASDVQSTGNNAQRFTNQILLICNDQNDKDYLRGLFTFTYGADIMFDSTADIERQSSTDCSSMIVATVSSALEKVQVTNSVMDKHVWLKFRDEYTVNGKNYKNVCGNRLFSRVIFTRKDILIDSWDQFTNHHLNHTDVEKTGRIAFDSTISQWNHWDKVAIDILAQPKYLQSSQPHEQNLFEKMTSIDFLTIFPSHLVTGSTKSEILRKLVKFINSGVDNSNGQLSIQQKQISCIFALSKAMYLDLSVFMSGRRYLMNAFSSKGLLCQIKNYYSKADSLNLISFPRLFTCLPRYDNESRIQSLSTISAQVICHYYYYYYLTYLCCHPDVF
jgi:hypothetical protein